MGLQGQGCLSLTVDCMDILLASSGSELDKYWELGEDRDLLGCAGITSCR